MQVGMIHQVDGTYKLSVRLIIPPTTTTNFALRISREEQEGEAFQVLPDIPFHFDMVAEAYGTNYGNTIYSIWDVIIEPLPNCLVLQVVVDGVLNGQIQGQWLNYTQYLGAQIFFPKRGFTQAEFNAAVAANVAASTTALQTAYNNAQTHITTLQTQITQLQQGNVNLQQLEAQGTILLPKRRTGAYTIKDFTVLNAIYRTGNPPVYNKRDLDFINVQMLGVQQAVRKMYQVGVAKQNALNTSAIFRRRANRLEEYSSMMDDDFVDYLFECVRIMNYCVDEIRFRQFFNLTNPTLLRIIEPKP